MFIDGLKPHLIEKGWYGRLDKSEIMDEDYLNWRLKIIYQTNLSTSYSAGRYSQMMRSSDTRPIWVYSAVLDNRTRAAHRDLHGKSYRYDHPFWEEYYPPNGWRCRCSVYSITEYQAKERNIEIMEGIPSYCLTKQFCPEEWRYNPGYMKWSPDWSGFSYLKEYKMKDGSGKTALEVIKEEYKEKLFNTVMTGNEWSNRIDEITKEGYKSQEYNYLISNRNGDFVKDEDTRLYVRDTKIWHSIRKNKPDEKKLTKLELKRIYEYLYEPDMVLRDTRDGSILYIKKTDDKVIKIVFNKKMSTCLSMTTVSKIDPDSLKGKEYKILYSK